MALIDQYKDSDQKYTITVLNNNTAEVINSLSNLLIYVYIKETGKLVAKYSIDVIAGYGTITVTDSDAGQVTISLNSSDVEDMRGETLMAKVVPQKTDASFSDGINDGIFTIELANLLEPINID